LEVERKRKYRLMFRVDEQEKQYIEDSCAYARCRHLSDYLRRQAMHGKILVFDMASIDFLKRQVAGACNNINQIARAANAGGAVLSEEIQSAKKLFEETLAAVQNLQQTIEGNAYGRHQH